MTDLWGKRRMAIIRSCHTGEIILEFPHANADRLEAHKIMWDNGVINEEQYAEVTGYHDFTGVDLSERDLRNADLVNASFFRANLRGARLNGANPKGAFLVGADSTGASLVGANHDRMRAKERGGRRVASPAPFFCPARRILCASGESCRRDVLLVVPGAAIPRAPRDLATRANCSWCRYAGHPL